MKLEGQVCSLENARRLQELGVERDSLFFWQLNKANKYFEGSVTYGDPSIDNDWAIPFPAYTVAELGSMLPDYIELTKRNEEGSLWWCEIDPLFVGRKIKKQYSFADTMADASALMLIWLIENGHVDVKELS